VVVTALGQNDDDEGGWRSDACHGDLLDVVVQKEPDPELADGWLRVGCWAMPTNG
jgi:hypothetical protein